jgi:flagellar basal-body rod modification protein FlgD
VESYVQGERQDSRIPETYGRIVEARIEEGRTILVMESGATVQADAVTALRQG